MAITAREKELVAVGISVAAGCKPCTSYHVKAARRADASDDDIGRVVAGALAIRDSATRIMRRHASTLLPGGEDEGPNGEVEAGTGRLDALVAVGAAFGVNCVSSLEAHLALAGRAGISRQEIGEVIDLARFVKERAASHVERLVGSSPGRAPPEPGTASRPGAAGCPDGTSV